ncbi:MAG TPA: NAD(P)-dependent oxidoreductase [Myxococcota bacterium]
MTRPLPADELRQIADGLRQNLSQLANAHVLVTGASGFFGRWLVETLVAIDAQYGLGLTVSAVARDEARLAAVFAHLQGRRVRLIAADVRDVVVPGGVTHVVHAATTASAALNDTDPAEMISVIVDGTRRVLAQTTSASRFLFVSSGAVYGPQRSAAVDETVGTGPDPLDPRSAYAEGKRLAETLCAIAGASSSSRTIVTARAFAFVGPGLPLDAHFAIGNFIADGLAGRPIIVAGDGTPVRSYLYASELTLWLLRLLLDGRGGRAYNVGSDVGIDIRTLAETVGAYFGVPVEVRGTASPGVAPPRYVPAVARIADELGLHQQIDLASAIARTVRWHRGEAAVHDETAATST